MLKNKTITCQMCEDHAAEWTGHLSYPVNVYDGVDHKPGRVEEDLHLCERCKRQMDEQGDLTEARSIFYQIA